jgi:hypothetical protein
LDRTVSDELPGFVPEVVRGSPGVLLVRPERALDAMLSGWRSQMVECALTVNTIKARCAWSTSSSSSRMSIRGGGARWTSMNSSRPCATEHFTADSVTVASSPLSQLNAPSALAQGADVGVEQNLLDVRASEKRLRC